jgi:hypothetical protein
MDPLIQMINCLAGVAAVSFFAAFVLTFWPGRVPSALAAALYGIGIMSCLSPPAYYRFSSAATEHGWSFGYDRFPPLGWLMPVLLLCFGIAATVLLWPSIAQRTAIQFGALLFMLVAPVLILIHLVPEYLQVHRVMSLDLRWILYAILWFRIRESYGGQRSGT